MNIFVNNIKRYFIIATAFKFSRSRSLPIKADRYENRSNISSDYRKIHRIRLNFIIIFYNLISISFSFFHQKTLSFRIRINFNVIFNFNFIFNVNVNVIFKYHLLKIFYLSKNLKLYRDYWKNELRFLFYSGRITAVAMKNWSRSPKIDPVKIWRRSHYHERK